MVELVKYDLRYAYKLKRGYKVYLGYEVELDNDEKVTLHFSSRRNKDFFIKPDSEVKVIIYSKADNVYIVDTVMINAKGIGNVDDVLEKYGISYEPVSSEGWHHFKYDPWDQSYIYIFDKGFYTWLHDWLDIDIWTIDMVSKDGVNIPGMGVIKEIRYRKVGGNIPKGLYTFLKKMVTMGCSLDEYNEFKDKYVNISGEIKFKEVTV